MSFAVNTSIKNSLPLMRLFDEVNSYTMYGGLDTMISNKVTSCDFSMFVLNDVNDFFFFVLGGKSS